MSNATARLVAFSIVILAGASAVGLGDIAGRGDKVTTSMMAGFWLLGLGGSMFFIDYWRSWLTHDKGD